VGEVLTMTVSEMRRAEAIKAYQDRQAKAAQDAEKKAERVRRRQAKWSKTSKPIVASVNAHQQQFARDGCELLFDHHPGFVLCYVHFRYPDETEIF
jgi:hypothetical protein